MLTKTAIRLRIRPPIRRSGIQRLRAKLYYRKNRARIRLQRRRYLRMHRSQLKHRKMMQRYKPTWFKHPSKQTHPHRKFKLLTPKKVKRR